MPFKSKAQARKLFAVSPRVAREFASKTLDIKRLPERKRREDRGGRVVSRNSPTIRTKKY